MDMMAPYSYEVFVIIVVMQSLSRHSSSLIYDFKSFQSAKAIDYDMRYSLAGRQINAGTRSAGMVLIVGMHRDRGTFNKTIDLH